MAILVAAAMAATVLATAVTVATPSPAAAAEPVVFQEPTMLYRGASSTFDVRTMATGDVNGDDITDVVIGVEENVSGFRGSVRVLLGDGEGGLSAPVHDIAFGGNAGILAYEQGLALADFDGDDVLDIAFGHNATGDPLAVFVFPGHGDGTFGPRTDFPVAAGAEDLTAADVDDDGDVDLVASHYSAVTVPAGPGTTVSVLRNDGTGSFAAPVVLELGQGSNLNRSAATAVGDLDGQPGAEIVVATPQKVAVFPADGNGGYGTRRDTALATQSVRIVNVDADADLDVVAFTTTQLVVLVNDGAGNLALDPDRIDVGPLQRARDGGTTPVDVDGDGHLDLVVAIGNGVDRVAVAYGDGAGGFALRVWASATGALEGTFPAQQEAWVADPVHLDGDGRLDLLVGSSHFNGARAGSLNALFADAVRPRSFLAPFMQPQSGPANTLESRDGMVLADLTGDGLLDDVSVHNSRLLVLPGDGDGGFSPTVVDEGAVPCAGFNPNVAVSDLDADGNDDIVCGDLNNTTALAAAYLGPTGAVVETEPINPPNTERFGQLAVTDLNADGFGDVVVARRSDAGPGALHVFVTNAAAPRSFINTTNPPIDLGNTSGTPSLAVGDFDEDGHVDLVSATDRQRAVAADGRRIIFHAGNGDGTFAAAVDTPTTLPDGRRLRVADLDDDGHLDLVGVDEDPPEDVEVLRGIGDGTFAAPVAYATDTNDVADLADIDADGVEDLIVGTDLWGVEVRPGIGDGTFGPPSHWQVGGHPVFAVDAGDLDGDGDMEIASTVRPSITNSRNIVVLHNLGSGTAPPPPPDLTIEDVTAPPTAEAGVPVDISYTVHNDGGPVTATSWIDRVYLSEDGTIDAGDRLIASVSVTGPLAAGGTYERDLSEPLVPPHLPGAHHVLVRTDVTAAVAESDESDQVGAAPGAVDVTVPVLDGTEQVSLSSASLEYRAVPPAPDGDGQVVSVDLDAGSQATVVAGDGRVPTALDADLTATDPDAASIELLVPPSAATTFVLVAGRPAAGVGVPATISLRPLGFEVTGYVPDHGSRAGTTTVGIRGGGLGDVQAVQLVDDVGGVVVDADLVSTSSTFIEAAFDLTATEVGAYDLVLVDGDSEVLVAGEFTVTDEPAGGFELTMLTPGALRTTWSGPVVLHFRNAGGTDIPAPMLRVVAHCISLLCEPGALTLPLARFRPPGHDAFDLEAADVFPSIPGAPFGILPAGADGSLVVEFVPDGDSLTRRTHLGVTIGVETYFADDPTPVDWPARLAGLQPRELSASAWSDVVAEVARVLGPTEGSVVSTLHTVADEAAAFGVDRADAAGLLAYVIARARVQAPGADLTGTVLGPGDTPVDGAVVTLTDGESVFETTAWHDGTFAARDVPPGVYRLEVDGFRVVSPGEDVAVPGGPVVVEVEEGGVVTGTVTAAGTGAAADQAVVEAVVEAVGTDGEVHTAVSGADGTYRLSGLPLGATSVRADGPGLLPSAPVGVDLAATPTSVVDIVLAAGGDVAGTVVDELGSPVAGALVAVTGTPVPADGGPTADDGTFALTGIPAGDWTLVVTAPGHGAAVEPVTIVDGAATDAGTVELEASEAVDVVVTDSGSGAPIADARVAISAPAPDADTRTGADGHATIDDLPTGTFEVQVSADGYAPDNVDVDIPTAGPVAVALDPAGTVAGVVHDGPEPLAGMHVLVVPVAPLGGDIPGATTGADGSFAVHDLPMGAHRIVVNDGLATRDVVLDASTPSVDLDIELEVTVVEGRIVDGVGDPVAGALVVLANDTRVAGFAETAGDGRFEFPITAGGDFDIRASGAGVGFLSHPVTVVPGTDIDVGDLAGGTHSIVVTATTTGTPIAGASVQLTPATGPFVEPVVAVTGPDGIASFTGVADGEYLVRVRAEGLAHARVPVTVAGDDVEVEAALAPGETISGQVVDGDGVPVAGAVVRAIDVATSDAFGTQADSDGRYTLVDLPVGVFDLYAVDLRGDQVGLVRSVAVGVALAPLTSGPGPKSMPLQAPADVDVTVSGDRSLIGNVSDGDGNPVAGARVDVVDDSGNVIGTATTDGDGKYGVTVPAGGDPDAVVSVKTPAGEQLDHRNVDLSGDGAVTLDFDTAPVSAVTGELDPDFFEILAEWTRDGTLPQPERSGLHDFLDQRLDGIPPGECPEQIRAWLAAQDARELARRAFYEWTDAYVQFQHQAPIDFGIPALKATKMALELYLERMTGGLDYTGALAGNVGNLAEQIGNVRLAVDGISFSDADGAFGAMDLLSGLIASQAAQDPDVVGHTLGPTGSVLGRLSQLADAKGIWDDFKAALGSAAEHFENYANRKILYDHAIDQYQAAIMRLLAADRDCDDDPDDGPGRRPLRPNPDLDPDPPPPAPQPGPLLHPDRHDDEDVPLTAPLDPNEIVGPAGVGAERWVAAGDPLAYTIRFENLGPGTEDPPPEQPLATAPAIEVVVTHVLDDDVDLDGFALGPFGWADVAVVPPTGAQSVVQVLDETATIGQLVRASAALDRDTRTVTWRLTALDPATGEPPTHDLGANGEIPAGFLPPEPLDPEGAGQGFATYVVDQLPALAHGTTVDATASITFDANVPIVTSTHRNTVDATDPVATVDALPAIVPGPLVTVTWSSSDLGAGVEDVDVWASVDGGPFELWLDDAAGTTAAYPGATGHSYAFSATAVDAVGNGEIAPPLIAEATTHVDDTTEPPPPPPPDLSPNERIVVGLYRALLGRDPDPAGLAYWAGVLGAGTPVGSLAGTLVGSHEYTAAWVSGTYRDVLGRAPDAGGLEFWVAFLQGGAHEHDVLVSLLASGEFAAQRTDGTRDGFVEALYRELLGRAPDAAGLAAWRAMLERGVTPADVVRAIVDSAEHERGEVAALYRHVLGREPDDAGLAYFVSLVGSGTTLAHIAAVLASSPEAIGSHS